MAAPALAEPSPVLLALLDPIWLVKAVTRMLLPLARSLRLLPLAIPVAAILRNPALGAVAPLATRDAHPPPA